MFTDIALCLDEFEIVKAAALVKVLTRFAFCVVFQVSSPQFNHLTLFCNAHICPTSDFFYLVNNFILVCIISAQMASDNVSQAIRIICFNKLHRRLQAKMSCQNVGFFRVVLVRQISIVVDRQDYVVYLLFLKIPHDTFRIGNVKYLFLAPLDVKAVTLALTPIGICVLPSLEILIHHWQRINCKLAVFAWLALNGFALVWREYWYACQL
jgi:hypothetical protein